MQTHDYWLIAAFFTLVLVPAPWLGRYLYRAMEGERTWLTPLLGPLERLSDQAGADHRAIPFDQRTVGLPGHRDLCDAGDGQGIGNPQHKGEGTKHR